MITLMSDSRGALHRPFRSDVWILPQTVVCFSLWFDRFCASVPAVSGREPRSRSGQRMSECVLCVCPFGEGSRPAQRPVRGAVSTCSERSISQTRSFRIRPAFFPQECRPKSSPRIGGRQIDDTDAVSLGYRKSYPKFSIFDKLDMVYSYYRIDLSRV